MATVLYYPKEFEKYKEELLIKYKDRTFMRKETRFLETIYYLFNMVRYWTIVIEKDHCSIHTNYDGEKSIQRVIPDSHRVLKLLKDEGFLLEKVKPIPKRRTAGYIFTDKALGDGGFIRYKVVNKKIAENISKKNPIFNPNKLDHLDRLKNNLFDVEIDEKAARNKIKTIKFKTKKQRLRYEHSIDVIVNKDFHPTQDDAGRIYTPVVVLPKKLRPFLRFKGSNEKLCEVDLANSQPLFISLEMVKHYNNQNRKIDSQSLIAHDWCVKGILYEKLLMQCKYVGLDYDRDKLKIQILKIYFSSDEAKSTLKSILKEVSPAQIEYFDEIKAQLKKIKIEEINREIKEINKEIKELLSNKNYSIGKHLLFRGEKEKDIEGEKQQSKRLASKMIQNIEAEMFINTIVPSVYKEIIGIKILTIHDSLLVEKKYTDEVVEIILQEFEKKYGVRPLVRVK